jgi:Lipocalin-like domain
MLDPTALLGTWKMVLWKREIIATVDALGPDPSGYINYGADGRFIAMVVSRDRPPPTTHANLLASGSTSDGRDLTRSALQ